MTESKSENVRVRAYTWTKNFDTDVKGLEEAKMYSDQLSLKLCSVKGCEDHWHTWSIECGEENKRYHLQGASVFKNARTLKAVNKLLGAFCIMSKGTAQNNVDYIHHIGKHAEKKGLVAGTIVELGKRPEGQGNRTDIDELHADIKAGKSNRELYDEHFSKMMKYPNVSKNYRRAQWEDEKRDPKNGISVEVLCGDPGLGKSHYAYDWALKNNAFWRSGQDKTWWDGYAGEKAVVLEEFDWKLIPIDMLKVWLDKYPCRVAPKNGSVPLLATKFLITCNDHPRSWYPEGNLINMRALARRMTIIDLVDLDLIHDNEIAWNTERKYVSAHKELGTSAAGLASVNAPAGLDAGGGSIPITPCLRRGKLGAAPPTVDELWFDNHS